MAKPTGQRRPWDLELNSYPFVVARNKGVPAWAIARVPDIEGHITGVQDKERDYRSTHSGYGWGQYQVPNTYHYATSGGAGTDAAGGIDARYPGQIIMGPLVTAISQTSKDATYGVTGFFEKGSYIYTISGKYVNRIDPATDTVAAAGGFPYDLTTGNAGAIGTVGQPFNANVVIGMTTASNAAMVSFDGTNWTVLSGANVPKGAYLARYWEDTDWRLAVNYLYSSNPSLSWIGQDAALNTGADWAGNAGQYGVGDQSTTVTGLIASERTLFIGMSDGLYSLEGQAVRAPLLIPAMPRDSANGKNLMVTSEGAIWYPCASGLYHYDPVSGSIDNAAPGRGLPDRSGIAGAYTALASFRAWVFCAVYDGTHSYIMAGRQREDGEPGYGPYIWHGAIAKIASAKVTSMLVSSLVSPPRLWLGLSTGDVAYFKLPSNGDNPLNDGNYRYATSGSLIFPADDYDVGGMRWQLSSVVVETEGLTGSSSVTLYERRDQGSWVAVGSAITTNGRTVVTTTTDKRFSRCELRLDIVNGNTTAGTTPVVRVLAGRATRRPTLSDVISTTVLLSDEAVSRMNIGSRYTAKNLSDQLDVLDSYYPVAMNTWWSGSSQAQTAIVTNLQKRMILQEGDDAAQLAADITLRVVA